MSIIRCGNLGLSATCINPHRKMLLPSSATIKIFRALENPPDTGDLRVYQNVPIIREPRLF